VTDYFNLITTQERLEASQQIVKTAQDAAEAQLANGRSTLPEVLNARAATARAAHDQQASIGAVDYGSRCTAGDHRGRAFGRFLFAVPISIAKPLDSYGELKMVCDGILRTQVRDGVES
jgi:hypothetical protein